MQVGTLCRVVVRYTHTTDHFGDLVLVLDGLGTHVLCFNPRTTKQHHYREDELEVLCR